MKKIILNKQIITPLETLSDTAIIVDNGEIDNLVDKKKITNLAEFEVIHSENLVITPGLIDVHVHGGNGFDTLDSSLEALNGMSLFFAKHGVTGFYPTTLSATREKISEAIENLNKNIDKLKGAKALGIHLEGPYLNHEHKGAQAPSQLRVAQPEEYQDWIGKGSIRLITIAPEVEGARELIDYGVQRGVEFAIGHSGASYDQVIQAANSGVRQSTHTFNGMQGLHHRKPGTVGGILTDNRIYAQIISDGVHLHPATVKLVVLAKGIRRTILITDSVRAAGLEDGSYDLGELQITVKNGVARIASGSLAGSTLTMDKAVRNVMQFANLSFKDAVTMATYVPAEAMRILNNKGYIKVGADADLTFFDKEHHVAATMANGEFVYKNF